MKQLIRLLKGYWFARPYRLKAKSRKRQGWPWQPCFVQSIFLLTLTLTLAVSATTAQAQVVTPAPLENSIYDSDTFKIADQLQCPVCQGVTVAYSNSGLAQQMRILIKKKLEQGETREQILQYFVDRYGESILTNPPKSGFTLLVWLLPIAGLLVGAGTVGYALRSWKARIRPRSGLIKPLIVPGEAVDEAGEQPAKENLALESFPSRTGLDPEKLEEYQARVEAELAAFAYHEEWGEAAASVRANLAGSLKPGTGSQTNARPENKPAGKG